MGETFGFNRNKMICVKLKTVLVFKHRATVDLNNGTKNETIENFLNVKEDNQIEIEEVIGTVKLIKRGKTVDHDEMIPEIVKYLGSNGLGTLSKLGKLK